MMGRKWKMAGATLLQALAISGGEAAAERQDPRIEKASPETRAQEEEAREKPELGPLTVQEREKAKQWVAELGAGRSKERDKAQEHLAAWLVERGGSSVVAVNFLKEQMRLFKDMEVLTRLEALVTKPDPDNESNELLDNEGMWWPPSRPRLRGLLMRSRVETPIQWRERALRGKDGILEELEKTSGAHIFVARELLEANKIDLEMNGIQTVYSVLNKLTRKYGWKWTLQNGAVLICRGNDDKK